MRLTGPQQGKLSEVLREAFKLSRLREILKYRLDKDLDDYALGDDYKEIAYKLIDGANREGWIASLVAAAATANPSNDQLVELSHNLGMAATSSDQRSLERIVKDTNSMLDPMRWRTRLGEIESQVCQVKITANAGNIYGTGFLLGPNLIMTSYHVLEAVIKGEAKQQTKEGYYALREAVIFRFDYKRLNDGKTINGGINGCVRTGGVIGY